ncbi:hypothetical protein [Streptomyces sp. NPDC017993]|uniref:hypothetical protein n=1 Tax=Streptomyces sp. NPDC017993 TaxID=3365027 RepID=UPI0037936AB3
MGTQGLAATLPESVHVGLCSAYEFEAALLLADALFTSPGSTNGEGGGHHEINIKSEVSRGVA